MKNIMMVVLLFFTMRLSPAQQLIDDHFNVSVSHVDSVFIPNRYPDQQARDSVFNTYKHVDGDRALEEYLLAVDNPGVTRTDSKVSDNFFNIKLSNGKAIKLTIDGDLTDIIFVEHFNDLKLLLFRIEWLEGSSCVLIDRTDGKKTHIIGYPFFSPDKKYMMSINASDAGGDNGYELYQVVNREFKKIWKYDPEIWQPLDMMWINNTKLVSRNDRLNGTTTYTLISVNRIRHH